MSYIFAHYISVDVSVSSNDCKRNVSRVYHSHNNIIFFSSSYYRMARNTARWKRENVNTVKSTRIERNCHRLLRTSPQGPATHWYTSGQTRRWHSWCSGGRVALSQRCSATISTSSGCCSFTFSQSIHRFCMPEPQLTEHYNKNLQKRTRFQFVMISADFITVKSRSHVNWNRGMTQVIQDYNRTY